jgi:hypothetical protein
MPAFGHAPSPRSPAKTGCHEKSLSVRASKVNKRGPSGRQIGRPESDSVIDHDDRMEPVADTGRLLRIATELLRTVGRVTRRSGSFVQE